MQTIDALLYMAVVVVWIAATSMLVPFVASQKGRNGWLWALASAVFSPLLALIVLAAVPGVDRANNDARAIPRTLEEQRAGPR